MNHTGEQSNVGGVVTRADPRDAAEEMLALLIDLYKHGYTTGHDHDRVRAVIRKATGREPPEP